MKLPDPWQAFSFEFKQSYDGAYGYLDHCGEFVSHLRSAFGFFSAEPLPTGCRLELPENQLHLTANCNEMAVIQQGEAEEELFLAVVKESTNSGLKLFRPFEAYRNTFTLRVIKQYKTLEQAYEASLALFDSEPMGIAKVLGLQPQFKETKYSFKAGSHELDVHVQPVTISLNNRASNVPQPRMSKGQTKYLQGILESLKKPVFQPGYGIIVMIELMENEPPPDRLDAHYKLLGDYTVPLLKIIG